MIRIAIIGAGVSGLTCARLLRGHGEVVVFEQERNVGGLVRCRRENGSLFHLCGGHVFNTKIDKVRDWFWDIFDRDADFTLAKRHSAVCLPNGRFVDYPIENHVYQLDENIREMFYADVREMLHRGHVQPANFKEFLLMRFGRTLYELYFGPYNAKIWRQDLEDVPLAWLEGKLPMPTPQEMLDANERHMEDNRFVHSSFFYPKNDGSQFIVDTLATGIDVRCGVKVSSIKVLKDKLMLHFSEGGGWMCDYLIFCGNLKSLPGMVDGINLCDIADKIDALRFHGTTAVFCETDRIRYSWFYQPSEAHKSHRFICTGNFAQSNSAAGKMTCTVEFTDEVSKDDVLRQLPLMPFHPRYVAQHYSKYTYPIQSHDTRELVRALKRRLLKHNVMLVGRFAEWEYFNMDAAMSSAMRAVEEWKSLGIKS